MMKKTILCAVAFWATLLTFGQSIERQVISSYGGSVSNTSFRISQTMGDLVISSNSTSSFSVSQGFQQTNANSTSVEENRLNFSANIYPNPTSDLLTIEMSSSEAVSIDVELIDLLGRAIATNIQRVQVNGIFQQTVDLSFLAKGTYVVRFMSKTENVGTMKIVKH